MTFAEKLDLLMNITNTTNSLLARNISMDASFISRLRRGVRTPARNVTYLKAMVEYFTRNCRAEYQKAALWEAIKSSNSQIQLLETESIELILYKWLNEKAGTAPNTTPNSIDAFLDGMINFQFRKMDPVSAMDIETMACHSISEIEVFYGMEGKQNAVLTFLSLVLKNKSPQTLLLYSDEDLGWLTDNPQFTLRWATLLAQVIRSGNRIKIIHTVNRGFDEMLSGIKQWVPIYMTGAIEPYYYPKTRDGLFRRTLFISPDTAALTSSSVGSKTKYAANFLCTNKITLESLVEEYKDFLALCRPLMRIFTPYNQGDYLALLNEFEDEEADTIVKTDVLSNITMPSTVVESILARIDNPNMELMSYQQKRTKQFKNSLHRNCFTEIFPLPDVDKILAGKVVVNFSDMLNETQLFYTPEEYGQHLQSIIGMLKTCENYHVHITSDNFLEGSMIYVREDVGVLVGKTLLPSVIFAINESNMTAAFWDYMKVILKKECQDKINRTQTICELEALATRLEVPQQKK